ncbi:MAG: triose-phosphate isomerase [Limnochordia bacterium]|jgi:triosephosphate isomerase|nr:triose-phosphate isomerase [Limnochordia bacterium]MDD2630616.1 triose-phosphate isomerase [Limnochordia bacterium]MDD4518362.1 triose-phosphate isomerase [Limnochordia bacterium]
MRQPIIAGNWKMNGTIEEAEQLSKKVAELTATYDNVEVVVIPVFTALSKVYDMIKDTNVKLGAQNLFWEEKGAYTGEISPTMLLDVGCEYVVVGHSERRQYFHETDQDVNTKVKAALKYGLKPIMCVGETLEQREQDLTEQVVIGQLQAGLRDVSGEQLANIVIAYEPVWAIGTGKTATSEEANRVIGIIRDTVAKLYDGKVADAIRIQYGGSVKANNAEEIMQQPEIDGCLVGGASLDATAFMTIVAAGAKSVC